MKYEYALLSLSVIISNLYTPKMVYSTKTDLKRFIVVSGESEAKKIFRQIFRESDSRSRTRRVFPANDIVARKRICEDVSNSYAFRRDGKLSYEKYADPLTRLIKNFPYPEVNVPIIQLESEPLETMFQCLAQDSRQNVDFYVTDEYNLNTADDSSTPLIGRFIFQAFVKDWPLLYALAELPANTISGLDRNVESIYLRRRGSTSVAPSAEQDALCGLSKNDVQRICVAVFNAEYFEETFEFSNVYEVNGYCERRTVSFQTDEGRAEAAGRGFQEWMLSCKPDENESIFDYWQSRWMLSCKSSRQECTFDYWLTHAYRANEIFIYFRHNESGDVFLENLSVNVRLTYGPAEDRLESRADEKEDGVSNKRIRLDDTLWVNHIPFPKRVKEKDFSIDKLK